MSRPQRMEDMDFFNFPEGFPATRRGGYGMRHFDCEGKIGYGRYPNTALVKLYAKLGLHRYNFLEATNLQLDSLKSFNMRGSASPYYINLVACLPATGLQQIFQVLVVEECLGILDLTCPISRPREVAESSKKERRHYCEPVSTIYRGRFPHWPSSEIAFSDTKRFYLVKESELQYNDWISLYVELAICTYHRSITARDLSKFELEIVQVAKETLDDKEPPRLNSKNVFVYITYKDLAKARIGEPCDRKAIVRRVFDEATGALSIQGKYWCGEKKALASEKPSKKREKKAFSSDKSSSKKKSAMLRRRLGVQRFGRLSNPRRHHPYKNRGRVEG